MLLPCLVRCVEHLASLLARYRPVTGGTTSRAAVVCVLCYGSRSSIVAAVASASLCCLQKDTNGLQRNHMSVAFVCFHPRSALHPMYLLSLPRPTLFEVSCQRNLHHLEVLYHIRPYFVGIFPYIGLTNRPYIW